MKLRVLQSPPIVAVEAESQKTSEKFEVIGIEPTAFTELLTRSQDIATNSVDYAVCGACTKNLRLNEFAGLTFIPGDGEVHHSAISRYALGQLGTKIGVPATYLERCVKTGRISLAQDNVNSWLETYGRDLLLREYDGRIRGVLSSKYSVCDSHEILEIVQKEVDLSHFRVKGHFLNEERLHVRLVSTEMLPIDGEDLFAGIFIDSSDVGRSLLTVYFGIYKQVCTNGLIVARAGGVMFQQRHIGITPDEFQHGLAASLKNVDVLVENAAEWIKYAKSNNAWGFKKSMNQQDTQEFLDRVRVQTRLPEEGAKKVLDLMQTKYGDTRWGLINSITEVAQDYTLERRLELERYAGNLLVA